MIRVLVVDDDFRVAGIHAAFVTALPGFEVVGQAHTAVEALAACSTLRPDLVLLDNYLPDRTGLAVCADLASEPCDVIMVTADTEAGTVRGALGAGALNFLVKPFGRDQLAGRLKAYAKYRARVARGTLTQEQIDAAMSLLRDADRPPTPKGQSPVTARLVRDALEESPDAVTAAGLATELGIARATAHRYLSALVDEGRALMRLRYGTTGRPEHEYVWRR